MIVSSSYDDLPLSIEWGSKRRASGPDILVCWWVCFSACWVLFSFFFLFFFFKPLWVQTGPSPIFVSIGTEGASWIEWREVSNGLSLGRRRYLPFWTAREHRTRAWIGLDMRFDFAIVMCLGKGLLNYNSDIAIASFEITIPLSLTSFLRSPTETGSNSMYRHWVDYSTRQIFNTALTWTCPPLAGLFCLLERLRSPIFKP